ncbi:MAG: Gldg family protein [Clostridia bacterium]|nr:Gldg family protein [Clostridia bacterium]
MRNIKLKKPSLAFWHNPRFRYGSLSTALLCVAIALLIALNGLFTAMEKKYGWRVDCSFNSITSHSEGTETLLAALDTPVHIYALYERGNEDLLLFELLDRYAAASPLVTWEQAPLSLNPALVSRFTGTTADNAITKDSLIVHCEKTDRFRVLDANDFITLSIDYDAGSWAYDSLTYESSITSAIAYVTRETIPVVHMVQGHDELDANTTAALEELLLSNHFDVRYGTLSAMSLDPADLLVFMAPVRDLTDTELTIVTDFAARGGALLFACDYSDPIRSMPNYQALLRSYGFLPREGVVVAAKEDKQSYFEGNRTVLLPQMQPTDATFDLMLNGTTTVLLSTARAFEMPDSTDPQLTVTPMLLSGEGSYLRSLTTGSASLTKQAGDPDGPFPLALEAYRFSETGDVSRAVIIGSSAALTSEYYYSMTHAQEFIIRIMEYLLNSAASDLHIMARTAVRPGLSAEALTLGSLLLVAIPLAVVGAALLILYPRRHR